MVKRGAFTAEIVHADSKDPFPEHTASNGDTYVEVEPKSEYYIRIKSDRPAMVTSANIFVDGKPLGYTCNLKSDIPDDVGIWSLKNGISSDCALKFVRTLEREGADSSSSWTGMIKVEYYEAIYAGNSSYQKDWSSTWNGGNVGFVSGISDPDKKKGVKSEQGSALKMHAPKKIVATYAKGALLGTIKLHYCSTLGLVKAGILPKPPGFEWDELRARRPRDPDSPTSSTMQEFPAEPEMKRIKCNVNGIEQEVDSWMFDLTNY